MQIDQEAVLELARAAGFQTGIAYLADGSFGYNVAMPVVPGNCFLEIERLVRIVAQRASEGERERLAKEFDRLAEPGFGFYDIHEPSEIIRDAGITKEQV